MSERDFYALQELAYVVKKNSPRASEIMGRGKKSGLKVKRFFEGLINNKFANDEEAAAFFYERSKDHSGYQKLRRKLQNRLINSVFFIDTDKSSYTRRQKAYYTTHKDWAAVKILLGRNARLSGVNLCHKILRKAKKYEFTELVLDISRTLRLHYGSHEGDLRKYERYNNLFKEYETIWKVENDAEELYTELVIRYVNSKATKEEVHARATEYHEQLLPSLSRFDSYRLHLCGYLIRLIIHTSVNDYEKTIEVCDEGIRFFERKKYVASVPLQIFYYQQLVCFTQLKKYQEGKAAADRCLEQLESGSFNWFKYQELLLTLSMHTSQYQAAYDVFQAVTAHRRFQYLPPAIRETWKIFEAYIHYLVERGLLDPEETDTRFNKFRLGKFLNETPIFSKDKRGMNIPILIIQILFMIELKRYDQAIDRIEAIQKYCSRYLRKDDTFRSNCFIKMLLQIPLSSFHRAGVIRRADKYRKKLESVSLEVSSQTHEIEIIPYEELWDMVLDALDNKFYRS